MDDIDRQIVALLREDARRSFQSIGLRVSLSAPAVKRRVDRLEADGVVRGYAARIDPGPFGWGAPPPVALFFEGGARRDPARHAVTPPAGRAGRTAALRPVRRRQDRRRAAAPVDRQPD